MSVHPLTPRETILIVEDEPEVLSLAMDLPRMQGYTVLGTGDPRSALRLARTRTEPIHLLLTDVVMPLMSGKQLAPIAIELEAGTLHLAPRLVRPP